MSFAALKVVIEAMDDEARDAGFETYNGIVNDFGSVKSASVSADKAYETFWTHRFGQPINGSQVVEVEWMVGRYGSLWHRVASRSFLAPKYSSIRPLGSNRRDLMATGDLFEESDWTKTLID